MNGLILAGTERDILAQEALKQIPTILTLLDRNRHSPTYGCFDRIYWHYRIIDFPSGMAQEYVLPLALAYTLDIPGNPYYGQESIKEWIEAGILYAAKSAHSDGSCDDYFPFERAGGAASLSLLACLDAYRIINLDNTVVLAFFEKRADWLAGHQESGRLSNHQAMIALCLELMGQLLDTDRWKNHALERLSMVLSWQTEEGWFWEYEGCDPGYLTLTITILARIDQISPSAELTKALAAAVAFAAHFIHPDGSFGGEYGSRNSYNFFPHGFELLGRTNDQALAINDLFLGGLREGRGPSYADDHMIGHHTWNYFLAWQDFVPDRPAQLSHMKGRKYFPTAKLMIERQGEMTLYVALNKGGVFKVFWRDELICSDTQFSIKTNSLPPRNAVGHLVSDYAIDFDDCGFVVSGDLGWAKQTRMTTINLIALRLVMLTFGRLFPNLIRSILQRMLITGKISAPYTLKRSFEWSDDNLVVEDELTARSWNTVENVALGVDQTSIYVVMSRIFQTGQLLPWRDLTASILNLKPNTPLKLRRRISNGTVKFDEITN
jgi:hypothetical protein